MREHAVTAAVGANCKLLLLSLCVHMHLLCNCVRRFWDPLGRPRMQVKSAHFITLAHEFDRRLTLHMATWLPARPARLTSHFRDVCSCRWDYRAASIHAVWAGGVFSQEEVHQQVR